MHSSQYLRLAVAADDLGWEICAVYAMPATEGVYPSAYVIAKRDHGPFEGRQFVVSMGVLPVEAGREAFFVGSTYDMDAERASEVFTRKCEQSTHLLGVIESDDLLRIREACGE